jgi:nicotinate-nucleotide pyrophosphorylase (carboxylating)
MTILQQHYDLFWREESPDHHLLYRQRLPTTPVEAYLHIKTPLFLAGLPCFWTILSQAVSPREQDLWKDCWSWIEEHEGRYYHRPTTLQIPVKIPFSVAVTGERLALNLLQRMSAVATTTYRCVEKIKETKHPHIAILDTRKTTPGLRPFEKYAVAVAGGKNHRSSQTEMWMIKDNHKACFGGLEQAWNFFQSCGDFYKNIIVEIHHKDEFFQAKQLGCTHFLFDHFSPEAMKELLPHKTSQMYFELSGGFDEDHLEDYLNHNAMDDVGKGIDAISIGGLTHSPRSVDLSFKYKPCSPSKATVTTVSRGSMS